MASANRLEPYLASEDSRLFREVLRRYSGGACLEIGAGNGGGLLELSERFGLVLGTDLVRPSMADWGRLGGQYVLADGASCVRDSSFDLVAFNPPYLRMEKAPDRAVGGGADLEVPLGFLREALRAVRPDGLVVFLLNDEADFEEFRRECSEAGRTLRPLESMRVFFEELTVYEAAPIDEAGAGPSPSPRP